MMDITFLSGLGAFAKENGVALLCLIFFSVAVWRILVWLGNNILLPWSKKLLDILDVLQSVLVALGRDVSEIRSRGCARMQPPPPPAVDAPATFQLNPAH